MRLLWGLGTGCERKGNRDLAGCACHTRVPLMSINFLLLSELIQNRKITVKCHSNQKKTVKAISNCFMCIVFGTHKLDGNV